MQPSEKALASVYKRSDEYLMQGMQPFFATPSTTVLTFSPCSSVIAAAFTASQSGPLGAFAPQILNGGALYAQFQED